MNFRTKIFIYYTGSILTICLAAIVLRKYLYIDYYSLCPTLFMLVLPLQIIDEKYDLQRRFRKILPGYALKYRKDDGLYVDEETVKQYAENVYSSGNRIPQNIRKILKKRHKELISYSTKIFLIFTPWLTVFILSFPGYVKIAMSVIVIITAAAICETHDRKIIKKDYDEYLNKLNSELEEQKKREELGRWK
mgnify:FL=1